MTMSSDAFMKGRSPAVNGMQWFSTNDGCELAYQDYGAERAPPLILIHGFTGSSEVFKRIVPRLSKDWRVIAPELRGHGKNPTARHGYHVSRLAMDLQNLIDHLDLHGRVSCIGTSLGCAVLWSYCELFNASIFSHLIFVDQAPLQNYAPDWGAEFGNRSCNSAAALAGVETMLKENPDKVYRGTIASCLGYRSHPLPTDAVSNSEAAEDEAFFLDIARQGDGEWFGKLMADHTALDWRDVIQHSFSEEMVGDQLRIFVVSSVRSGCFPPAGPDAVIALANGKRKNPIASGSSIDWGGHWCYWENPDRFVSLVSTFMKS